MLTLRIPFEIPSQNATERRHWTRRAKEKDVLVAMLRFAQATAGDELIRPPAARRMVFITAYRRKLITDHANLVGGCKTLIDALVALGLLHDDSDQFMVARYAQGRCREAGYASPITVIRIVDAPAGARP